MRRKFKLRKFKIAQFAQYFSLMYFILILSVFPLKRAIKLGKICGAMVYFLDARHRKEAAGNVSRAYRNFNTEQVYNLVRKVYEHIGIGVIENLFLPRIMRKGNLDKFVKLENFAIFDKLLAEGKGLLVVIAHLGNWEMAGLAVALRGYPIVSVARPMDNPYLDKFLNRFRTSTGQGIIPKRKAITTMSEVLAGNKLLVILADQDARGNGVFVDFFGQLASTYRSPALLALRHKTPIVPVNIYRDREGLINCIVTEPIYSDGIVGERDEKVEKLSALYTARLEQFIRERPEQWMWMHRRWKTQKPPSN